MGNFFSKYYYNYYNASAQDSNTTGELNEQADTGTNHYEEDDQMQGNGSRDELRFNNATPPPQSEFSCQDYETPPKSAILNRSKVFAAYVPDSPERFSFHEFSELKLFLNSPVGKKKGTRFKRCDDEKDLDNFYNEQINTTESEGLANTSNSSTEPDLPYKEIPARVLTTFRMAIEKQEHERFAELLAENPRFLVNTSNDSPTIVHIGYRYNALHVAARASNFTAAEKILNLITDNEWLTDAYATDRCVKDRSKHLLEAMLNTPDKIDNNTPLHYACKCANSEIVELLLKFKVCDREPKNKHNNRPIDLVGLGAKGNKIRIAFHKESLI